MEITLYHNPHCSKSRGALALIRAAGFEPHIIDYLVTPLSRQQLRNLQTRLQLPLRAMLRETENVYGELGLHEPALSDDALLEAIVRHPVLLNRPIVVTPLAARLCRPPELVLELLSGNGLGSR